MTATRIDDARRILAAETAGAIASELLGAGVVSACDRFCRCLAPVIGETGVRALLARSLTLTLRRFPWLASPAPSPLDRPWLQLRPRIAEQPADQASEAAVALLATFMELLGALIGDRLSELLVHAAWPETFPPEPPKETL